MVTRRPRSPKYPQLPLREAIERVGKVYQSERTHKVPKLAVAKDLNYGSLNGASVSLIGTLKSYGLLHEDKDGVRVTDDAVTILRAPESHPDKAKALQRAAFAPRIFNELREAYGEDPSGLPGETALRYELEKRGFLEKATGEVIRIYRDNLELVSETDTEYTEAEPVGEQPGEADVQTQQPASVPQVSSVVTSGTPVGVEQGSVKEFLHIFVKGCEMRLLVDGAVTQEAIDRLIAHLELDKEDLPLKSQLEHAVVEQPTIIEMPEAE